jgi:hypothetical protein
MPASRSVSRTRWIGAAFTIEVVNDINTPNVLSALTDPKLAATIAAVKPFFDAVRNYVTEPSKQRLQPKVALLAQRVAPATAGPAMKAGFDVRYASISTRRGWRTQVTVRNEIGQRYSVTRYGDGVTV